MSDEPTTNCQFQKDLDYVAECLAAYNPDQKLAWFATYAATSFKMHGFGGPRCMIQMTAKIMLAKTSSEIKGCLLELL